jgi:peroxiredoxin
MKNTKLNLTRMKNLKGIAALVLILLLSTNTNIHAQEVDRGYIVEVGQPAPDFTVITTDGNKFKLSENRGKVIMIQFTASWCSVCRKEMPHIEKEIWKPLKDKTFMLIGLDRDEPSKVVAEFAKKMKITYPLAPDLNAEVFSLYALKEAGVTRNVIIDKQGKIVYLTRLYDEKEFNTMKNFIFKLITQ